MSSHKTDNVSVLFVCLGNICRSPSAESVFRTQVANAGLSHRVLIDSCGTAAYHIGERPDSRSITAAKKRGYDMSNLIGRQLTENDFLSFNYILAMDEENLRRIQETKPDNAISNISLFLDFHPDKNINEVPDPYYGGDKGFDHVLDLIETASSELLSHLKKKHLL